MQHARLHLFAIIALAAAITSAMATEPSAPQEPGATSRLERIRQTGTLVLAYRENAVPFSYLHQGQPVGFGVDIAKAVADDLREHLGLPQLHIRWNAVTLSTRIPLMTTNTVDMECATTTHTRSRARQVSFSHTFYVAEEGVATRTPDAPASQTGKTAVVESTVTASRLRAAGKDVLSVRSNRNGMLALLHGEADAFVAAMPLLASERLQLGEAGRTIALSASGGAVPDAYACMLPLGDTAFITQVNKTLERLMRDGEMARLHDRWFTQPIPPGNRTLGLPLNQATREAYATPNSTPFE
ncbi:MAG: amino acid ABC transporter substrate-binding protein [Azonexus sp.]|jgi:glutamate/aspartate transport system substrate-binding protein|uniref:amino acid ABC transporter substrate-binding protein n=1 Tax=Azonexus sp. TaxID=1872668 RepID=UPI00283614D0|nr:amino acid ABC transporter substrate-binding protein [Azonexus sp.]MDR0776775.1 amino acid ABC transporter substrate-binding protein [Azonexus sp.]